MLQSLELSTSLLLFLISLLAIYFINNFKSVFTGLFPSKSSKLPRSYPIFGSYFTISKHAHNFFSWSAEIVNNQPSSTFALYRALGQRQVITANPSNVQHILKTNFSNYQKGSSSSNLFYDFLGQGIFNVDGQSWKFQRQLSSHEFNTRSLRKFVESVVDTELSDRLVPILRDAEIYKENKVLDFQDILQRFAFDNICNIAFGYDQEYLSPSLPDANFAVAYEKAVKLSIERSSSVFPFLWKFRRFFQIGSEKELATAIKEVRELAKKIIKQKKKELNEKSELQSVDLLSRFLSTGHLDENFITDIVMSFILAGRDTTSAALTWFFYLISKHPFVENMIVEEIYEKSDNFSTAFDEVKDMVYIHAALCESMRLYPPVPTDGKVVMGDDVLPDGTAVYKGEKVIYHVYAMGRSEKLWGPGWAEFRPERWLKRDGVTGKWCFVGRDPYVYPVFQAGPRVCLGKEMAFVQMKRVVAGVLRLFRVVPVVEEGKEPVYLSYLTSKMLGGFPVRIEKRS